MAFVNFINFMLYVILVIEIILIIYFRKILYSLIEGLLGKKKGKTKAQKSGYEEVRSYILKELDKGYAYEQISESLLKVGWTREMIDSVISDIISRKRY